MQGGLRFADKAVLTVAWLVTCGLVYLFGFYLGKGMQEVRYGREERVVRLPVESEVPPVGSASSPRPAYEFYGDLVAAERRGATSEQPRDPAARGEGRPVGPGTDAVPHAGGALPAAAKPDPAREATVRRSPSREEAKGPKAAAAVARGEAAASTTVAPAAGRSAPTVAGSGGRGWTVRTRPLASEAEADALRARLRARGYAAQVVQARRDGAPAFVLVVGRYPSAGEAATVMRKLRTEDGVAQAFVASE